MSQKTDSRLILEMSDIALDEQRYWRRFLATHYDIVSADAEVTLHLHRGASTLALHAFKGYAPLTVDFSKPPVNNAALQKAMGDAERVIDATCGLAVDAYIMSRRAAVVTLERHPLVFTMVRHALSEAAHLNSCLHIEYAEATDYLKQAQTVDTIYLDPMYPNSKQKSQSKKHMQWLAALIGDQPTNNEALLSQSLIGAKKRVVVKRPHYAEPLSCQHPYGASSKLVQPVGCVKTKLVRYDIYKPITKQ